MASADIMDDKYFYEKESNSFLETLLEFHRNRGTPIPRFPVVGGQKIDLFKLYNAVTEFGGWHRVNNSLGWEDLLTEFGIPRATGNGAQALKLIYARYLWPYEKNKRGEDLDDDFKEVEAFPIDRSGTRGGRPPKRPPASVGGIVPLSYNHRQHELNDATRAQLGLAPAQPSDFRNILRSLASSLPNEVDFTLNVCGVLSAEAQAHPLSLAKAPSLLTLLLAQAGIFELSSSSSVSHGVSGDAGLLVNAEEYNVKLRRNFWRFWLESTHEFPSLHEFIYPVEEDESPSTSMNIDASDDGGAESMVVDDEETAEEASTPSNYAEAFSSRESDDRQRNVRDGGRKTDDEHDDDADSVGRALSTRPKEAGNLSRTVWSKLETLIPSATELALGSGRKGGARDVEMARVAQILVILRNLSFEEENKAPMTNDANCLRFLFLCIHSKYSNLMQMGLDTLANLASKFALDECGSKTTLLVFEMLHRLLHSDDRFQILRGLEILGSLATVESNEEILVNALGKDAFNRVTELLTVTDLQILVGSLDCLYQITNAGQLLCSLVMSATTRNMTSDIVPSNCPLGVKQLGTNKMIRLLVDFLTLEASSLGPSAVSSIRVVEIRPAADSQLQKGLLPTPYQQTNYMYTANPGQTPAPPPAAAPLNEPGPTAAPVPQAVSVPQQHFVIQNSSQGRSSPVVIIPQQPGSGYQIAGASENSGVQAPSNGGAKQGNVQMVHGQPTAITVKGGQVIPVVIYQPKEYQAPSVTPKEYNPPKTVSSSRVEVNGEEFARNWLSCNYEAGTANEHIARNTLYQAYTEVTKTYGLIKNEIVTSGAITKLVSVLFPSVIVRRIDDGSGQQLHHGGLRKKANPLPMPPLPPKHGPSASIHAPSPVSAASPGPGTSSVPASALTSSVSAPSALGSSSAPASAVPAPSARASAPPVLTAHTAQVLTIATQQSNATSNSSAQSSPALSSPLPGAESAFVPNQQHQNENQMAKDPTTLVQTDKPRDSNLIKSLLASKLTMKMDKSSLVSPNTDFAVVASVLQQQQQQQQQQHPQPPTDPPSAINSPGNIKTYARTTLPSATGDNRSPSAPNYAIHDQASSGAMLEAPTAMMAAAAAAAAAATTTTTKILVSSSSSASSDLVDGQSDACSEDSRHSVSSLDSGKGSTTVPSTSVSPESHPTSSSSSHPSVHNVSHHGGAGEGATSSTTGNAPGSAVKYESTLVKKMLAGVVNLNGGETKEADPTSVSSALTTVANGVANGHPIPVDKDKNVGVRDVPQLQQHAAQTNGVRLNGILPSNGGINVSDPAKSGLKRGLEGADDLPNGEPEMKVVKMEKNIDGSVTLKTFVNGDVSQETKVHLSSSTAVSSPLNHSVHSPASTNQSSLNQSPVVTATTTTTMPVQPNHQYQPHVRRDQHPLIQQQLPQQQQHAPPQQQQQHAPQLQQHAPQQQQLLQQQQQPQQQQHTPQQQPLLQQQPHPQQSSHQIQLNEHAVKIIQPQTHPVAPPGASIVIQTALHHPQPRPVTPSTIGTTHPRVIIASGITSSPHPSPNSLSSSTTSALNSPTLPAGVASTAAMAAGHSSASPATALSEEFSCEWSRCSRAFSSPKNLFHHVCTDHVNSRFKEGNCLWGDCDSMRRKRWSLVSHLQDRHCNEQALKLAALRRRHKLKFGSVPTNLLPPPAPQHPGYAPNAAMLAIKRHSHLPPVTEFINEQEGPVTRDIRLTSAIVLKNLARHSETAQRLILRHERLLSSVAFRCMEASNNVAQCLAYIPVWMRGSRKFSPETLEDPEAIKIEGEDAAAGARKKGVTVTGSVAGIVAGEIKIQEATEDDDSSHTIVITT